MNTKSNSISDLAPAPSMATPVQQQQACAAPASERKPSADEWVSVPSRIHGDNLIGVIAAYQATVMLCTEWYLRALPVVRVEGGRHVFLGHARNEDAAATLGAHWRYAFDVAVRVIGDDGPLAYVLLGDGQPADVAPEDLRRLAAHASFKATISAVDAEDDEVDECSEHAVRWFVGDADNRWEFDGHNPACRFSELCDAVGFIPALDGTPPFVATPCQQQQACAAAPVPHPPGLPTHGWLDKELKSYVDGVLRELMPDDEDAATRQTVTELEIAETHAYAMTKAWIYLYEQDCALPLSVPFGDVFDARQRLQDAHARVSALKNAASA